MKKQPGDQQSHPNNEAEQAYHIHQGQLADSFRPKPSEVGDYADGEKCHHEKQDSEHIRFPHGSLQAGYCGRLKKTQSQHHRERQQIAKNEFGKPLPNTLKTNTHPTATFNLG